MPSWFMAIPSQTPIVENSIGVPPAILTPSFTACAILPRCMCPGITSLAELAMPMMRPVEFLLQVSLAPKRLLCGAFRKPFFILSDLLSLPFDKRISLPRVRGSTIDTQNTQGYYSGRHFATEYCPASPFTQGPALRPFAHSGSNPSRCVRGRKLSPGAGERRCRQRPCGHHRDPRGHPSLLL